MNPRRMYSLFVLGCIVLTSNAGEAATPRLSHFIAQKGLLPASSVAPQLFLPADSVRSHTGHGGVVASGVSGIVAAKGVYNAVSVGVRDEGLVNAWRPFIIIPVAQECFGDLGIEDMCDSFQGSDLEMGYGCDEEQQHSEGKKVGRIRAVVTRAIEFVKDHKATSFMMSTAAVSFVAAGVHFPHTLPVMLLSALGSAGITCGVSWFFKRECDLSKMIEEALRSGAWSVACMGVNVGLVLPLGEEVLGTLATRALSGATLSAVAETIRSSDKIVIADQSRINVRDVGMCAVLGGMGGVAAVGVATGKEMLGKLL